MIESSFRTYLQAQSTITDLVSTRIYPGMLPESASLPAVTYHVVDSDHRYDLTQAAGFAACSLQVDVWDTSYASTKEIGEALRQKLQAFSGTMGSDTIHVVVLRWNQDLIEKPAHSNDSPIYHLVQRYEIIYPESVPSF